MNHPGISMDWSVPDQIPSLAAQHEIEAILLRCLFSLQINGRKFHDFPLCLCALPLRYKRIHMDKCAKEINNKNQCINLQGPEKRLVAGFHRVYQASQHDNKGDTSRR